MTLLYLEILTALLVKKMTGTSKSQNPIKPLRKYGMLYATV